ncbi:MAG: cysS [Parcubacteria group bacterium]|nr:cysS [Parcubacteria group bacterium]
MWPFKKPVVPPSAAPIFFTNTLTGKKDLFVSLKPGVASMYSCGPTVYGPQHIGNLRAALFADTIARVLLAADFHVRRVINITDVGHLVGDGDEGEDKMKVGAEREQVSPAEIANRYTKQYLTDIKSLNIDTNHILFPRASEYIQEQIAMIESIEEKGYAYQASDGVYFDTAKLPDYGKLGGIAQVKLMGGARIKVGAGKRNLHDFALWRKAKPGDLQQWPSPWGSGNPGWHIECSAMIRAILGREIDIHTGGMDHIPVHHNNEIAQSEVATGRPLARYWLHEAFITIEGEKISKSLGNEILLSDITARGFHPLSLRYFYYQASFRTPVSFSWEAIAAAHEALQRLWRLSCEVMDEAKEKSTDSEAARRMVAVVRDDLATPAALALLWETLRDEEMSAAEKLGVLTAADAIFGLALVNPPEVEGPVATEDLPQEVQVLILRRDEARQAKEYKLSDEIREELEYRGYRVDDGPSGTVVTPSRASYNRE